MTEARPLKLRLLDAENAADHTVQLVKALDMMTADIRDRDQAGALGMVIMLVEQQVQSLSDDLGVMRKELK